MLRSFFFCCILSCFTILNAVAQPPNIKDDLRVTVQRINDSLKKHTRPQQLIRLLNDSIFVIEGNEGLRFIVNTYTLMNETPEDSFYQNGIMFDPMIFTAHVPTSFINFTTTKGSGGFIKFYDIDNAIVQRIYELFQELYQLMIKVKR